MRALTLALGLLATPLAAAEQQFAADDNGTIAFRLPSGNIACTYVPEGGTAAFRPSAGPVLSCDRVLPAYAVLTIGASGAPLIMPSPPEPSCCSGPVLRYGNFWEEGPFRCTSERTGLTCRREDGRGFSMARRLIELF